MAQDLDRSRHSTRQGYVTFLHTFPGTTRRIGRSLFVLIDYASEKFVHHCREEERKLVTDFIRLHLNRY